jgi:hypothetical protein
MWEIVFLCVGLYCGNWPDSSPLGWYSYKRFYSLDQCEKFGKKVVENAIPPKGIDITPKCIFDQREV